MPVSPVVDRISLDRRIHDAYHHWDVSEIDKYLPAIPPQYGPMPDSLAYDPTQTETVTMNGKQYQIHWGLCSTYNSVYNHFGNGIIMKLRFLNITLDHRTTQNGGRYSRIGNYHAWIFHPYEDGRLQPGLRYSAFCQPAFSSANGAWATLAYPENYKIKGMEWFQQYGYLAGLPLTRVALDFTFKAIASDGTTYGQIYGVGSGILSIGNIGIISNSTSMTAGGATGTHIRAFYFYRREVGNAGVGTAMPAMVVYAQTSAGSPYLGNLLERRHVDNVTYPNRAYSLAGYPTKFMQEAI